MKQSGWKKTLEQIRETVLASLGPLEAGFGFHVESVEIDGSILEIVARNEHVFLRVTWDPRDRFFYYIGPLVNQQVPSIPFTYQGLGVPSVEYEIAWFSELAGELLPMVRSQSGPISEAVPNAVDFLIRHASDCLRGDWSRRPALDALLEDNWRLHQL